MAQRIAASMMLLSLGPLGVAGKSLAEAEAAQAWATTLLDFSDEVMEWMTEDYLASCQNTTTQWHAQCDQHAQNNTFCKTFRCNKDGACSVSDKWDQASCERSGTCSDQQHYNADTECTDKNNTWAPGAWMSGPFTTEASCSDVGGNWHDDQKDHFCCKDGQVECEDCCENCMDPSTAVFEAQCNATAPLAEGWATVCGAQGAACGACAAGGFNLQREMGDENMQQSCESTGVCLQPNGEKTHSGDPTSCAESGGVCSFGDQEKDSREFECTATTGWCNRPNSTHASGPVGSSAECTSNGWCSGTGDFEQGEESCKNDGGNFTAYTFTPVGFVANSWAVGVYSTNSSITSKAACQTMDHCNGCVGYNESSSRGDCSNRGMCSGYPNSMSSGDCSNRGTCSISEKTDLHMCESGTCSDQQLYATETDCTAQGDCFKSETDRTVLNGPHSQESCTSAGSCSGSDRDYEDQGSCESNGTWTPAVWESKNNTWSFGVWTRASWTPATVEPRPSFTTEDSCWVSGGDGQWWVKERTWYRGTGVLALPATENGHGCNEHTLGGFTVEAKVFLEEGIENASVFDAVLAKAAGGDSRAVIAAEMATNTKFFDTIRTFSRFNNAIVTAADGITKPMIEFAGDIPFVLLYRPKNRGEVYVHNEGVGNKLYLIAPNNYVDALDMLVTGAVDLVVTGGTNAGNIDCTTSGHVHVAHLANTGSVHISNTANLIISDVISSGDITAKDISATLIDVSNAGDVNITGAGGVYRLYDVANSGTITVQAGEMHLEGGTNTGAITVHTGTINAKLACPGNTGGTMTLKDAVTGTVEVCAGCEGTISHGDGVAITIVSGCAGGDGGGGGGGASSSTGGGGSSTGGGGGGGTDSSSTADGDESSTGSTGDGVTPATSTNSTSAAPELNDACVSKIRLLVNNSTASAACQLALNTSLDFNRFEADCSCLNAFTAYATAAPSECTSDDEAAIAVHIVACETTDPTVTAAPGGGKDGNVNEGTVAVANTMLVLVLAAFSLRV